MPESAWIVIDNAALGFCVGVAYYFAYAMNERVRLPARFGWLIWAMHGVRIIAAALFFFWIGAQGGGLHVLSAFAGFLVGRVVAFRLLGRDG